MRVGHGYDIHRLVKGRRLVIGGVEIEHTHGLAGHSDADVLLHAIIDALLGAAALGDIGEHFPDSDQTFKESDSSKLLQHVVGQLHSKGWKPAQVDCTIIAERPKLGPLKARIRNHIAELICLDNGEVNIKAKTAERLGPVGRGKAIEAHALVSIEKEQKCRKKSRSGHMTS